MLESLKNIDILNPNFYIPIIIGLIVVFIVAKVAKKLLKLVIFLAVVGLIVLLYMHMR